MMGPKRRSIFAVELLLYVLSSGVALRFCRAQSTSLPDAAMFSDNAVADYASVFLNYTYYVHTLLANASLVQRFESSKYCTVPVPAFSSIASEVVLNGDHGRNALEAKYKYVSCEMAADMFCNPTVADKYVVTHSLFDCESFISADAAGAYVADNMTISSSGIKLISLAPSVYQVQSALVALMSRFDLTRFAVLYADVNVFNSTQVDIAYYRQFAVSLAYALNSAIAGASLTFTASISDLNMANLFATTTTQVVFLLIKCGTELNFLNAYASKIAAFQVSFLVIYDSPQCLPLVNYYSLSAMTASQMSALAFMYKLVPVDAALSNYASYAQTLDALLGASLSANLKLSSALDELEDFYMLRHYNGTGTQLTLAELNDTVSLSCFANGNTAYNESYRVCTRQLKFLLFAINSSSSSTSTTTFVPIGTFRVPNLNMTSSSTTATIYNMTGNYTFYVNSQQPGVFLQSDELFKDVLFVVIGLIIVAVIVLIGAYLIRSRVMKKELSKGPNKILLLPEDLEFVNTTSSIFISRSNVNTNNAAANGGEGIGGVSGVGAPANGDVAKSNVSLRSDDVNMKSVRAAKYKGDIVILKYLRIPNFQIKNSTMRELRMLRDLRNENLNGLLGCYINIKTPALVFEYASRGSLQDIIMKKDVKLDWNFKWSMLNDLCRGMRYLHHSPLKYHGNLKSRNCVVDSRWVLKLTDFGLPNMYSNQKYSRTLNLSDLLWTAPEHLRQTTIRDQVVISIGSQAGDIYSFSIIMQEIIVRGTPFCMMGLSDEEIISKIRKPPPLLRPSVSKTAAPPEYVNIMRDCWSEQPELRPSFDQLHSMFKSLNGEK